MPINLYKLQEGKQYNPIGSNTWEQINFYTNSDGSELHKVLESNTGKHTLLMEWWANGKYYSVVIPSDN